MGRRAWPALGAMLLLGAAALWALRRPVPGHPPAAEQAAAAAGAGGPSLMSGPGAGRAAAPALTPDGAPPAAAPVALLPVVSRDVYADPSLLGPEEAEARRLHRIEATRRAREAWRLYPPHSRPIAESEDLLVPEQIAPTVRPLADPRTGAPRAVVRQTQDRLYLRPGTAATLGLEAALDGEPAPVRVTAAVLVRWSGEPPVASAPIAELRFEPAGPGLAATFRAPAEALQGYTGELLVRAEAEVGGERGDIAWAFVYTGEPSARFTGATGDRLEAGSVRFDVGVEVTRPGRYRVQGRVDDSAGKPLALARWDGELAAGKVEVPLLLFGKIARDGGAVPPFALRDLEGFRLLDGAYPDRETMEGWRGPYRSRAYRVDDLSVDPWDGSTEGAPRSAP